MRSRAYSHGFLKSFDLYYIFPEIYSPSYIFPSLDNLQSLIQSPTMGKAQLTAMFFIYMFCMLISLPPIYACGYCDKPSHPPSGHTPSRPSYRPSPYPRSPPHHGGSGGKKPPHHGGSGGGGPKVSPPVVVPPIIMPPIIIPTPPVVTPPPVIITPPSVPCPPGAPGSPGMPGPPGTPGTPGKGGGGGSHGGGGYAPPGKGGGGGGSPPGKGGGGGKSPPGHGGGGTPPGTGGGGYGPPGGGSPGIIPKTCPIDALKLGLCLDVLGGLVHIGLGDPVKNMCCPVLQGLLDLEAALCLCTAIRLKLLNLNIYIPLALTVLATCGLNPPSGFNCPPIS
ncbi:36.4 kDa proline-rich protein-like [Chenopodium quinoa]|uniref:36.4 kDa proline-rich protein-like n=1 Tax=Chenopodium quinoa TaxID=63459 RepID=UPI000B795142|nr:36.4 kDa proline-rich protein-like [Chenopodium quinoa]